MPRWRVWWRAVVVACSWGCSSTLQLPSDGGRAWRVYRAGHVEVRTDLAPAAARELTHGFDRSYQALSAVSFGCARASSRAPEVRVVMFAERRDFEQLAPEHARGYFQSPGPLSPEREASAVFYARDSSGRVDRAVQRIFQHELTHRLTRVCFSRMPVWLSEGLAKVLETVRVEDGKVVLGQAAYAFGDDFEISESDDVVHHVVPRRKMLSVAELVPLDTFGFYAGSPESRAMRYASAWALTHMLMLGVDEYREPFRRYLGRFGKGDASPERAWNEVFGAAHVQERYARYIREMRFAEREVPLSPAEHPVSSRRLSDVRVRVLWARLSGWGTPERAERSRAWLKGIRAAGSDGAVALVARAEMALGTGQDPGVPWRLVERAVAAAPRDPAVLQALVLLAVELGDLDDDAVRRAVSRLSRRQPTVSTDLLLGLYELGRGHADSGVERFARALDHAPGCWQCLAGLGSAAAMRGHWTQAETLLNQAMRLTPEYLPAAQALLRARIEEVRAAAEVAEAR